MAAGRVAGRRCTGCRRVNGPHDKFCNFCGGALRNTAASAPLLPPPDEELQRFRCGLPPLEAAATGSGGATPARAAGSIGPGSGTELGECRRPSEEAITLPSWRSPFLAPIFNANRPSRSHTQELPMPTAPSPAAPSRPCSRGGVVPPAPLRPESSPALVEGPLPKIHAEPSLTPLPLAARPGRRIGTISAAMVPFEAPSPTSGGPPPGTCLATFSVVLTRPSTKTPLGFQWSRKAYQERGARVLAGVQLGSPLERWNAWQAIRGRAELVVRPGDQLLRADGRWAFAETEIPASDCDGPSDQPVPGSVLEFARWVRRPPQPPPPKLETWDSGAALSVSWMGYSPQPLGWAVCLLDVDMRVWHTADGLSGTVQSVAVGKDVSCVHPGDTSVMLYRGLARGRTYAASVAMLTEWGWSVFSQLSPKVKMTSLIASRSSDAVDPADTASSLLSWPRTLTLPGLLDDDSLPHRPTPPRYFPPTEVHPGVTAPVQLQDGPKELCGCRRQLCLRLVLNGPEAIDGLQVQVSGPRSLLVERAARHRAAGGWAGVPEGQAGATLDLHGEQVVPDLQPEDVIVRVNGLVDAEDMVSELERQPPMLALVLLRGVGGGELGEDDALFQVHSLLDPLAVQVAEDVRRFVLTPYAEGELSLRLVEHSPPRLEYALKGPLEAAKQERAPMPVLLDDALKRLVVLGRRSKAEGPRAAAAGAAAPSEDAEAKQATLGLRRAMADPACDPADLQRAIDAFGRLTTYAAAGPGQALLQRASTLADLWSRRQRCATMEADLQEVKEALLDTEARRRKAKSFPRVLPLEVEAGELSRRLARIVGEVSACGLVADMAFQHAEAEAILERLEQAARPPPPSNAFRKDDMKGPLRSLRLGEELGWWKRAN